VSATKAATWKGDSLEDDVERVRVPSHPLVLYNARVRQPLHQLHLVHQLGDLCLGQTLQSYPLHGDHLAGVQVECPVDRSELAAPDAISELLNAKEVNDPFQVDSRRLALT
jgi:hypothetical protein